MAAPADKSHRQGLRVVVMVAVQRLGRPALAPFAERRFDQSAGLDGTFDGVVRLGHLRVLRTESIHIRAVIPRGPILKSGVRRTEARMRQVLAARVGRTEAGPRAELAAATANIARACEENTATERVRAGAFDADVATSCGRLYAVVGTTARQIARTRFIFRLRFRIRQPSRTYIIRPSRSVERFRRFARLLGPEIFRLGMAHDSPNTVSSGTPVRSLMIFAVLACGGWNPVSSRE